MVLLNSLRKLDHLQNIVSQTIYCKHITWGKMLRKRGWDCPHRGNSQDFNAFHV